MTTDTPQQPHTLLRVSGASKSYNGIPALVDADLGLLPGTVHALIGENGAGKSTLIKLLAGVLPADAIHIEIDGHPVQIHHPQDAFRLGLRFIHQELNIVPGLSVAENIFLSQQYPTWPGGLVRWRKLNDQARHVLDQLGITHIAPNALMAWLSPGDQMLVKIASAFVGEEFDAEGDVHARVYVMDEPTAALTGQETAMLFAVIQRLKAQGCAILYISHRLNEIFQISDWVTVLRDGRVVASQPIAQTTTGALIHLMTGQELDNVFPPRQPFVPERIALDVRGLTTAKVSGVSFTLYQGEVLGVAGLNGSGRTELLQALIGSDQLYEGRVTFPESGQAGRSPSAAWASGMAYVPEERRSQGVILSRSVSDNVSLPHLRHLSRGRVLLRHSAEQSITRQLGAEVRLQALGPGQRVRQLSGGNQQKVVFARALVQRALVQRALVQQPRVLLLDEPTRGVDVGAKFDIYSLINQVAARGTGIIMVSSELSELIGLCHRILILRQGRLTAILDVTDDLTEKTLLTLCYGESVQ